jgi:dihydrofolate reductase
VFVNDDEVEHGELLAWILSGASVPACAAVGYCLGPSISRAEHPVSKTRPELVLVAALAPDGLIGGAGTMPWRLPGDLKRFKQRTLGHPILMGRTTFEGLGRALPGRRNLVLSREAHFEAEGAEVFTHLDAALAAVAGAPKVMVIGGAQIYALCLSRAHRLVLTLVRGDFQGDTWFPKLPRTWQAGPPILHPADDKTPFDCIDFELTPAQGGRLLVPSELTGWFEAEASQPPAEQST